MMPIVNVPVHPPRGWLLAIDTSSDQLGVALSNGEQIAELGWAAGRHQSTVLLDAVEALLRRVGIGVADLMAIGVAIGPGTFNGLRAGLGTAKGLALGADLPLIGIDTLAATALPVLVPGRRVVAVVGAGRGRVVSAVFGSPESGKGAVAPVLVSAPVNGNVDDLVGSLAGHSGPLTLAGELTDAQLAPHREALEDHDVWVPLVTVRGRRPAGVAALALDRWTRGESDDPETLDAVYRHSAARPAG